MKILIFFNNSNFSFPNEKVYKKILKKWVD